jgi:Concanavalin A-like lectin/glucanases superfamily
MRRTLLLIAFFGGFPLRLSGADQPDAKTREAWRNMSRLGSGFVVWESNRTGRWRLWRRELDGSGLRRISPEEAGRDHYCPHLSPNGRALAYLSYPAGSDTYQEKEPKGGVPLYLMSPDGSGKKQLTASARAYSEDRAVVWLDNDHLIYIDGDGFTRQMDVRNGKSSKVTQKGQTGQNFGHGFLINATRTHATTGDPTFSLYDAAHSRIIGQSALGGCQPYFSHDGKWGFWMGGAGGPINRIDLRSRHVTPILNLNDARMPKARSYLYFPMVSRDGRMFACAASPNQHDHFTADYDIFVARMDPKTLDLISNPVRYSFHPGCDRFPDVFLSGSKRAEPQVAAAKSAASPADKAKAWPSDRTGLVYVFETADKPNQISLPDGRPARSYTTHPRGRGRLDHNHAMVLAGGSFLADAADGDLLAACRRSNELTIEALVRPDRLDQSGPARIISFSSSAYSRNFTLGQERDKLIVRIRTPRSGDNGVNPETAVGTLATTAPVHVTVTYRPGELVTYLNGKEVYRGESLQGDFSNWAPHHLLFGDEFDGNRDWAGTLEGVAIYNRALQATEIERNGAILREKLRTRKPVAQVRVEAKLVARSAVPSLKEIKPYREALMVSRYRVTKVLRGDLKDREILVAQWALLDGRAQGVTSLKPGASSRLVLEPFDANPQLKRHVCKDGFDSERELLLPRYYDATP